jgi:acyl-CoA dehydrogenase
MSYGSYEIGRAFADQVSGLLPFDRRREIAEQEGGFSPQLWSELAAGGWLELGSQDEPLPFEEVLSAAEAAGVYLVPGPLSETATFVLPLVARWFPELAPSVTSGEMIVVPVLPGLRVRDGRLEVAPLQVRSTETGIEVDGVVYAVAFGSVATHLLVPIEDEEGVVGLAIVAADASGMSIEDEARLDLTASAAAVRFASVAVDHAQTSREPELRVAVSEAVLRLLHATTAESVGGIGEVLDQTVAYVSERIQFGVPVGSFQALKHDLADVKVAYELARGMVYEIGKHLDADAAVDVIAARVFVADAYVRACETAIQCHGGAGFTWEQGLHYWYRAALRHRSAPVPVLDLRRVAAELVWDRLERDARGATEPGVVPAVDSAVAG